MKLVKITDNLYVNPEKVISVEWREVDQGGNRGILQFTELTLETMIRWKLDVSLDHVVTALRPDSVAR